MKITKYSNQLNMLFAVVVVIICFHIFSVYKKINITYTLETRNVILDTGNNRGSFSTVGIPYIKLKRFHESNDLLYRNYTGGQTLKKNSVITINTLPFDYGDDSVQIVLLNCITNKKTVKDYYQGVTFNIEESGVYIINALSKVMGSQECINISLNVAIVKNYNYDASANNIIPTN